ncbi:MAG: hypothetical protein V4506_00335 [Bacteroidota bacterium]
MLHAQINMPVTDSPVFKVNKLLLFSNTFFLDNVNKPIVQTTGNAVSMQPKRIESASVNDLPFFCAMECRIRKHTNIWIKFRAGNDDSYMKMIHSATK